MLGRPRLSMVALWNIGACRARARGLLATTSMRPLRTCAGVILARRLARKPRISPRFPGCWSMSFTVAPGHGAKGVEVIPPINATFSGGGDRGLLGIERSDTI